MVEAIHRLYNDLFKHRSGIEMGDAKLAESWHRHNWDRAQKIYRDFPRVGHYDVWKIDILQKLVEQNTGKSIFSSWSCVGDFVDTDESFVTVPLPDQALHDALVKEANELKIDKRITEKKYDDQAFLCRAWNGPIAFLPIARRAEFRLFSQLMRDEFERFDADAMALRWIDHVNGETVFPKLPVQLRKYYRLWEKNDSPIQASMDQYRAQINRTMTFIAEQVPTVSPKEAPDNMIPMPNSTTTNIQQEENVETTANAQRSWAQQQILLPGQQAMYANNRVLMSNFMSASINQMGFGEFMNQRLIQPMLPAAMPVQLPDRARRLGNSVPLIVGGEPIQALHPAQNTGKRKESKQGDRGQDKKQRKARTCKGCIQSENQERMEVAQRCPGRAAGGTCWWQCQDALTG
jgi:hypothetical protein